jgi:Calcineurin-like phosphoesterase
MMIAFAADTHIFNHRQFGGPVTAGINVRCRSTLDALSRAVTRAASDCEALVILGDLFDGVKPEPQVIAHVQNILAADIPIIVLAGNHDIVSGTPGDNALGPLSDCCSVIEHAQFIPCGGAALLCVPFEAGDARVWLPQRVAGLMERVPRNAGGKAQPLILATHIGIIDGQTPPFLEHSTEAIPLVQLVELCSTWNIDAVFTGHWHKHRQFSRSPLIVQVGTLAPTGWQDAGLEFGKLTRYDPVKRSWLTQTIAGPRFVTSEEDAMNAYNEGCDVYLRLVAGPEQMAATTETLARMRTGAFIVDGEIVPTKDEAEAAARSAAHAAGVADLSLDEAVAAFVAMMDLKEGLTVDDVAARVKKYLEVA